MNEIKMSLQKRIYQDLLISIKNRNPEKTSALRVIVGELQRMPNKELKDNDVLKVLVKLSKLEKERLLSSKEETTKYLKVVESYIPEQVSEQEIEEWIRCNIDFTNFKNKMQAMRSILNHFGSKTDGNIVKRILINEF